MQPRAIAGVTNQSRRALQHGCGRRLRTRPGVSKHCSRTTRKKLVMYSKLALGLSVLVLIAAAPLLGACHTTAGVGQDISATGTAIDKTAVKATP
jgi:predicted small secreted protein